MELKFRHYDKTNNLMMYSEEVDGLEVYFENRQYDQSEEMQFTGLQDKNGKDIYEGDIVHIADYRCMTVVFSSSVLAWALVSRQVDGVLLGDLSSETERLTVNGNIHENP